jgi:release factor glutamine methyltransferase
MVPLKQTLNNFQVQPWTIKQALSWACFHLQTKDLTDPRLSAEVLLGSLLGLDRSSLIVRPDQALDSSDWMAYKEKIIRRAGQEPIAYLTGQKEFWSLDFQVNPEVLIPRPETELLVETALNFSWPGKGKKTLVELGTGSGAVAVALVRSLPSAETWQCLATDISRGALETARKNALVHGVGKSIQWVQGDWLVPFSSRRRWIDLLVSNPPYVADKEMTQLPLTVKGYEPLLALRGGPDGLDSIRQIFNQAVNHLKIGGWLLLEIGETQGDRVRKLAEDHRFSSITLLRDHAGKNRILKACYHG